MQDYLSDGCEYRCQVNISFYNGLPQQQCGHSKELHSQTVYRAPRPPTLLVRKHVLVTGAELLYPPNPTTIFTIRLFLRRRMFANASLD
jgi:hypothetical protein